MKFFGLTISRENRGSLQNPATPISASEVISHFGLEASASGVTVNVKTALGVPEVFAAVLFTEDTMASLPLNVFQKTPEGREKVAGGLQEILHDVVNTELPLSSHGWRKQFYHSFCTHGRGLAYLEWAGNHRLINIWPLDPGKTTIRRRNGRIEYHNRESTSVRVYEASEVIDLPFMQGDDGMSSYSPIMANKDVIGLAISATQYGSKFFQGGGIPPWVFIGPFSTPGGLQRSAEEMKQALESAARNGKPWVSIPTGHELKPLGVDPEKGQMVEMHRLLTERIARIFGLPPVFLQDLSKGTYSNTEQQDLNLVKHRIRHLADQFEQELNLKLFGRGSKFYVEFNLDGLLRGDFKTRMEGYGQAIMNGVLKPNEARAMENRPDSEGGDKLFMQGAMVPITEAKGGQKNVP